MTTADGAPTTPWRRLSTRMLLVHPVQEFVRALPWLFGLLIAGSSSGNGGPWGLIGLASRSPPASLRWFTTRYRITPEQVQLRSGLLRRRLRAVARDRVRTVDVTANPLHRVLGLDARHGRNRPLGPRRRRRPAARRARRRARRPALRDELLHRRAGRGRRRRRGGARRGARGRARARPAATRRWIAYGPFTLSGLVTRRAARELRAQRVQRRARRPARHRPAARRRRRARRLAARRRPSRRSSSRCSLAVALCSTAGYVLAFWGFRLTRRPGGTLHVTRGLLTTRATTIEERRLRGVELSEPLLLRAARRRALHRDRHRPARRPRRASAAARCCCRPAPRAEARRVAADVLRTDDAARPCPLTPHGPRARRRRFTRALAACGAARRRGARRSRRPRTGRRGRGRSPRSRPVAAALAADRARSLGHARHRRPRS